MRALFADWSPFVVAGLLAVLWLWGRGDERLRNRHPGDVAAGALIGTGCALLLLPVRRALFAATRVLNVAWTRIGLP